MGILTGLFFSLDVITGILVIGGILYYKGLPTTLEKFLTFALSFSASFLFVVGWLYFGFEKTYTAIHKVGRIICVVVEDPLVSDEEK